MNLETKITIYKFTPQVFTLTRKLYTRSFSVQEKSRYKVICNGLVFFVLYLVDQPGLEPGTSRL